jgi:hypothetical protein
MNINFISTIPCLPHLYQSDASHADRKVWYPAIGHFCKAFEYLHQWVFPSRSTSPDSLSSGRAFARQENVVAEESYYWIIGSAAGETQKLHHKS